MKLNTKPQIEMLGDLVSPQWAFFLRTAVTPFHQPAKQPVRLVIQSAVIVERATRRGAIIDLATPVMSAELENATHRLPIFQFSEN